MRTLAALALTAAIAILAAGCGGGGSGDKETQATIKQNWETFFDGSTSTSNEARAGLLQNGAKFASIIRAVGENPLSRQLSAKVTEVDVSGPNSAKVKYTLYLGKNAVLKNVEGDGGARERHLEGRHRQLLPAPRAAGRGAEGVRVGVEVALRHRGARARDALRGAVR